jgi:hypothetical protein
MRNLRTRLGHLGCCVVVVLSVLAMPFCGPQCGLGQQKNPPIIVEKLGVRLFPQETGYWCWAASGEMVMHYHTKVRVRQCDQANSVLMINQCCMKPVPEPCWYGGWVEYEKWGFKAPARSRKPLGWNDIVKQIKDKTPFTFTWTYEDGSTHTLVCYGYDQKVGKQLLLVYNPLPVNEGTEDAISYDDYRGNKKQLHLETIHNIERKP